MTRVVLVAAASQGLGLACARACARDGAAVALASRTMADVAAAAAALAAETGAPARGYACDVRDADAITAWVAAVARDFGRIDGLVVNAGGPPPGGFAAFDDAAWQAAYELTLLSAVRMIRAAVPHLVAAGGGSIVAITSSAVREPIEGLILSNVFRAGVAALVKSLSRELAPHGIRVNTLVPGRIATARVAALDAAAAARSGGSPDAVAARHAVAIPLGRYGTPDEFGEAAAFLLSPRARYITGTTLVVDGGNMHAT